MNTEQRTLLFKLTICQGMSNLGILKILDFAQRYDYWQFSSAELLTIAEISVHRQQFICQWNYWHENEDELLNYQQDHQFITILDDEYPASLREIYNCPAVLFYQGDITFLQKPSLAVVGARQTSPYGIKACQTLLPPLIRAGLTIVSGLAKGIDAAAHQVTLAQQGQTIAVVGTGLDVCYPAESGPLQRTLLKEGLVLSEYPNGTKPRKYHFPARNRIIAGLTKGTCVVEARQNSGSLITAQAALEYGREVFAIPGQFNDVRAQGCLKLIQEGAKCVCCAQDIMTEFIF